MVVGEQLAGQEPNSGGAAHQRTHRAGPLGQGEGQCSPCAQHKGTFSSPQDTMTGQERAVERGEPGYCSTSTSPECWAYGLLCWACLAFCAGPMGILCWAYGLLWLALLGSHGEPWGATERCPSAEMMHGSVSCSLRPLLVAWSWGRQPNEDTGVGEVVPLPGEGWSGRWTSRPMCSVGQAAPAEMGEGV